MKRVMITGANRGLGLALTRQLAERGERIFATCRAPDRAEALSALTEAHRGRVSIVGLDVTDGGSIETAHGAIGGETDGLDWLINNAGINYRSDGMGDPESYVTLGKLDAKGLLAMLATNSVGPVMVAQRFLDLLRAGDAPRIVSISSNQGSLTNRRSGGSYAYATSKAALNMLTRAMAFDVVSDGIVAIAINPGWFQSDMGGGAAPITAEESAAGVIRVVDGLTMQDAGRFLKWDGTEMPW